VGVRRGDTLLLYLDGDLQAQRRIGDRAVNVLTIRLSDSQQELQAVQLHDRALSAEEIAALSGIDDRPSETPQARDRRPALPMN
jgi:hydroxypyruvate isomerase